ncbi:MAG: AAA family ATPase [Nannocystaceae bacterium]|nr:AAA family ATPase [Nannocystaceae bacterium]
MTKNDLISRALELPSGAVFRRCALQVNPHSYRETFRGQANDGTESDYARAIVDKAVALDITILAITDHNSVSGIPAFRAAAEMHDVHIFPGFELSSSEGIHVLCIYPPETEQGVLERYLGGFGINETTPSSVLANVTFSELLAKVRENGGVAIAAHVTGSCGLLDKLTGQPRINAWRDENLLAIQIPGSVKDLKQGIRPIVENTNPDYKRPHAPDGGLAIAVVNAKDIAKPDDLDDRSSTCLIKMSEVSIEGLRQAFLDPGSRIRLNPKEEQEEEKHAELVAITWETSGFLQAAAIHFNRNLNVLVGGRGTGKSTVVESIRAVLGLNPVGDEARKAHEGIVRHVLRSGTKISLLVRVHRPSTRTYVIERTLPNPPIVRTESGEVLDLDPQDVLPQVEVFGQHEISELAKSGENLTRLLDRFVERDDSAPRRKSNLLRELENNRRSLLDTRAELAQIDERLAALPSLEETLTQFREVGLEEKLKEQSLLVREERLLAALPDRIAFVQKCAEVLRRESPIDRAFVSTKALEDLPGKSILGDLDGILLQLDQDVAAIAEDLETALNNANKGITTVKRRWANRRQEVQDAYEKILRELQKSRIDGEAFIRLQRQIEDLKPLGARQTLLRRSDKELRDRRRNLLADWGDLNTNEFQLLASAAKRVSNKLRNRVDVQVAAEGNREPLYKLLKAKIQGFGDAAIAKIDSIKSLSISGFAKACNQGPDALRVDFGLTPALARKAADAPEEVLMQIEELHLLPTTSIRLNTAASDEPPSWHELDALSTGQKATAVLLLLLLESDAPLVVDQPEDDLDNRFITEGIVPRMRDEKQRRQFIFTTHNANIPVLGDAELIVGLSAIGEAKDGHVRMDPASMGAIDSQPVRELVEEILEGGKEAFERRRRKYGF